MKNRKHHFFCHILVKHCTRNPEELHHPKIISIPRKASMQQGQKQFLPLLGQENECISLSNSPCISTALPFVLASSSRVGHMVCGAGREGNGRERGRDGAWIESDRWE
jgi:hypothetical protein